MRRLFILLDLAVARGPGLEAALRQLAIAIARAWGVWHRSDLTWGYSLYDSTCPDLLLRDSLRKAASNLSKLAACAAHLYIPRCVLGALRAGR